MRLIKEDKEQSKRIEDFVKESRKQNDTQILYDCIFWIMVAANVLMSWLYDYSSVTWWVCVLMIVAITIELKSIPELKIYNYIPVEKVQVAIYRIKKSIVLIMVVTVIGILSTMCVGFLEEGKIIVLSLFAPMIVGCVALMFLGIPYLAYCLRK